MNRHLLRLRDITEEELNKLLNRSLSLKKSRGKGENSTLTGKSILLLFDKPSTRTRISLEVAIKELGGYPIFAQTSSLQLSRGEDIKDTARTLSRYVHGIVIRTGPHSFIEEFAKYSSVPIINGLTQLYHPLQVIADLMTVIEIKGNNIKNLKFTFIGDGNNMANTWIEAGILMGFELRIATPSRCKPLRELMDGARKYRIYFTNFPEEAVSSADVIITDVWVSMGDDEEKKKHFRGFTITPALIKKASPNAIVLHCLPAHKGEEITEEVFEQFADVIFTSAENRLHTQKAVLEMLCGEKNSY